MPGHCTTNKHWNVTTACRGLTNWNGFSASAIIEMGDRGRAMNHSESWYLNELTQQDQTVIRHAIALWRWYKGFKPKRPTTHPRTHVTTHPTHQPTTQPTTHPTSSYKNSWPPKGPVNPWSLFGTNFGMSPGHREAVVQSVAFTKPEVVMQCSLYIILMYIS